MVENGKALDEYNNSCKKKNFLKIQTQEAPLLLQTNRKSVTDLITEVYKSGQTVTQQKCP